VDYRDAPSKLGTAGPHRSHIRATNDRITADNSGHLRARISPAHQSDSGRFAGRRNPPRLSDTEERNGGAAKAHADQAAQLGHGTPRSRGDSRLGEGTATSGS
jgi:hypothetical protein